MDNLEKYLDKLPIEEIYKDLLKPGFKKVGQALETVFDGANLILLPLKLVNSRSKIFFQKNMEKYASKLNKVESLTVTQVPQYVGLPIIDKLTYLDQNDLSEIFINLLTKASFVETLNLAHPAFINILNNLSSDEAKILFNYKNNERIPFIDIYIKKYYEKIKKPDHFDIRGPKSRQQLKEGLNYTFQDKKTTHLKSAWNLSGIEKFIELDFPNNIDIYLENLELNGLISFERNLYSIQDNSIYNDLTENIYTSTRKDIENLCESETKFESDLKMEVEVRKGYIIFTELGKGFINACIKEINEN